RRVVAGHRRVAADRRPGTMSEDVRRFRRFANLYKDSVALMQIAARLRDRDGIGEASCVMATPANLAQLCDANLAIDLAPAPSDLVVGVRGDPAAWDEALEAAAQLLRGEGPASGGQSSAFTQPLTSIALAV